MGSDQIKDQYILLTGSKNNAGDFLIKHRAFELFKRFRPERQIIDNEAWKPFSAEQLMKINKSRALILCGGPALQKNMRPNIYPMTNKLDDIKVPIIMMGIGWKSIVGEWHSTSNYKLNSNTLGLLRRIEASGYLSSVRDYHTLNVLLNYGFKNIIMTGCPALYSLEHINSKFQFPSELSNISFSMGVSFVKSQSMEKAIKNLILAVIDFFQGKNFKIVFHHSLEESRYFKSYGTNNYFWLRHKEILQWIEKRNIEYIDISASADNLVNHYTKCDLHIGYRVHAHLFMNSISKPSILITEDGRGKALKNVISGLIFDGYTGFGNRPFSKLLKKLNLNSDPYVANPNLARDIINNIDYEIKNSYPRLSLTRQNIDAHFKLMQEFISQLP